jgi:rhamnogalacturonyl hydrolase YesR
MQARVEQSLRDVVAWVQARGYQAWEPADGNASVLFPLTRGRVLPMRVLQQVVLRSPINIRPLLGVARHESAIGRGYMAWGYVRMYARTGEARLRDEAVACLDWLVRNRRGRSGTSGWGDPYDYATRGGRRPYGEPLLIWSALIGQAFLDAHAVLGDDTYLNVAKSVCDWILGLPREQSATGSCLSYVAYRQSSIHNANAMGAAFLARLGALTGNREALDVAASAMTYTCTHQRADGSWYYAEEPKYHWIDNFHTGYNLSALLTYRSATGDSSFDACLAKGARFYTERFFETDGRARYFHDATYPVDIQCAAQAIETLCALADDRPDCLDIACTVADWTIRNMQARDGHFYYRDLGWKKVLTPMLHWGQATMVKALAVLLARLDGARASRHLAAAAPATMK